MSSKGEPRETFWQAIWNLFLAHWSETITILFAVCAAMIRIIQTATLSVDVVLLSVLALIAVSQLTNDRSLKKVLSGVEMTNISADRFFEKAPDSQKVNQTLRAAHSIDIVGLDLKESIVQWYTILEDRVSAGARVRVMMVDPDCEGLRSAVLRSNGEDEDLLKAQYSFTLRKVQSLAKLVDTNKTNGSVEFKLLNFPPSFAILLVDDGKPNAMCLVKLYSHNGVVDGVYPYFELYPWREKWWYEYFAQQFRSQWESAHAFPLLLKER